MDDPEKICLLMTATISPRNCPDAQFSPEERHGLYLRAFNYYVGLLGRGEGGFDHIIFADNSGTDLQSFRDCVPHSLEDKIEILSPPRDLFPQYLGKNNEFGIIDYAVEHSVFLRDVKSVFFKVTGRYYFKNIESLINDVKKCGDIDLYCDQKDHSLLTMFGLHGREKDGETRFFACSTGFWKEHFYKYFVRFPQWRRVEDIMFEVAQKNYMNKRCRFRFRREPFIEGTNFTSGTGGKKIVSFGMEMSPEAYAKVYRIRWVLETLMRKMMPWLWF